MDQTSRFARIALPVAALGALGVGLAAGPAATAATTQPVAAAHTYTYAVTPYYTPTPHSPGAPYKLYSIEAGSTAHSKKLLRADKKATISPVASHGSSLLVDVGDDPSGGDESNPAVLKSGHLTLLHNDLESYAAGFLPGGNAVYLDQPVRAIDEWSAKTGKSRKIYTEPMNALGSQGTVSKSGKFLYYVGVKDGDGKSTSHVFRLTLASGKLTQLKVTAPKPWKLYAVRVSPNDKTLAVTLVLSPSKGGLVRRIGLVSTSGSALHVIKDRWSPGKKTADPHGLFQPFFAPDSRTILASYTTGQDTAGLVSIDVGTRKYDVLSGGKGLVAGPAF